MAESREAVLRWRAGQAAAAKKQRELLAQEGARPEQAIAESFAAVNALEAMGQWPGPRDPLSERAVEQVRRRWARVQQRAKHARSR